MKKQVLTLALSLAMLAATATGCASSSPSTGSTASSGSSGSESASTGDAVNIRILTRYSNPDNVREKYFMDMVEKFNAEHDNIHLEDISISDENSRDAKFKTSVASGDPIEVFNFLGYASNLEYVQNSVVADLSAEMEQDADWLSSYNKALFGPVTYDDYGVPGIYGVPTTPYGVCTFYNQAIFDKLDMELPLTWEAIEAATPILVENGYVPMAFGAKDSYRGGHFLTALSMKYYGSDLKDELVSLETAWNDEKTVTLIDFMQRLYKNGVFGSNNLAYTADGELSKLESGEAAICFSGSWNIATINGFTNAADIVCAGFPSFADKPEYAGMWMGGPDDFLSISSKPGDADYDATLTVLKYFTSYEYWEGLYQLQSGAGTYPVASFTKEIEADKLSNEFNSYYQKAENMIGEIEQYDTMPSLMDIVRTELQTIFSGNDAQDIADRIQNEVDSYKAG